MRSLTYSKILRAIGEDLEMRDLKTFDIRKQEDRFVVICGYQAPPAPTPITLEYTLSEIEELDLRGKETRSEAPQSMDFSLLSQTLRTIGGYLDSKRAGLLRVSNNDLQGTDPLFKIEYETAEGDLAIDERSGAALYDIGVHMYKQRGKPTRGLAASARWRR